MSWEDWDFGDRAERAKISGRALGRLLEHMKNDPANRHKEVKKMGATKDMMLEEAEREREEERKAAAAESVIGEAEECGHCGRIFPATDDGMNLCQDCLDEFMED